MTAYSRMSISTLAGSPEAREKSGNSRRTTELAPTRQFAPTRTPGKKHSMDADHGVVADLSAFDVVREAGWDHWSRTT